MMGSNAHAETFIGGAGADSFVFPKKDLADGSVDHITDFSAGHDRLDLSDFIKGGKGYNQVVRLAANDGDTVVQGLVKGTWTDIVVLDNVELGSVHDLGLMAA